MTVRILTGDCRTLLGTLADESVHCVVTSPPYFGLRDYGVNGQIGLEDSPAAFVESMKSVFREVRRVLRPDGTLWLNLGDSYANDGKWGGHTGGKHAKALHCSPVGRNKKYTGLKPKDLIGIPWRVAFALQDDGWYLRQDIIWSKPNPMPESVRDRCTKAHEYMFLLSKSETYYFDQGAILEPISQASASRLSQPTLDEQHGSLRAHAGGGSNGPMKAVRRSGNKARKPASARGVPVDTGGKTNGAGDGSVPWEGSQRNRRSVWTVTTKPFKGAHFATFPPDLIEPCILAGAPQGGLVLDPFGGAGTTGLVADRLGRSAILIELNPGYVAMARERIAGDVPLLGEVA